MTTLLSRRNLFIVSFIVLLATNIFVLNGIASNRADTESLVSLTERELMLPYRQHKENSGLSLRLQWRVLDNKERFYSYSNSGSPTWFNETKLRALGFASDELNYYRADSSYKSRSRKPLPKEVLIVLEANSPLHAEMIKQAEKAVEKQKALAAVNESDKHTRNNLKRAQQQLERERIAASRLYAIDAGLDLAELRQKYNDVSRFIIAKGLVRPNYVYHKDKHSRQLTGYIKSLVIERIHIPKKQRGLFANLLNKNTSSRDNDKAPRYQIDLAYGSRLEPWITQTRLIDTTTNSKVD